MGVYYVAGIPYGQTDELYHYGRKGMKWGQNVFTTWAEYMQGLGKKIGGAVNNARSTIGSTANNARNAAASAYNNVRKTATNAYNNAREYVTGEQARNNLNRANQNRFSGGPMVRAQAQAAYNRTLPGQMENLRKNAGQAMNNARNAVSTAYAEAAKQAGGAGKNIEQFYNDVMAKAKSQINAGKQIVAAYGSKAISSIQAAGEKALEGAKKWLDGVLNRARNSKKNIEKNVSKTVQQVRSAIDGRKPSVSSGRKRKDLGRSRAESNTDNYVANYQRVNGKPLPMKPSLPGWKNGKKIKR